MTRRQIPYGEHAYIVQWDSDATKDVIIFIHGILGDHETTWSGTPSQLISFPALHAFDYGSLGYSSGYIDFSSPKTVVEQITLWVRTHLERYENIFFVAHSLGGLLLRHAVVDLLGTSEGRELTRRFRKCFVIGSPFEGSWAAKALLALILPPLFNWKLWYLAFPKIDKADMAVAYTNAAQRAIAKSSAGPLVVPPFHHFIGSQDSLVGAPRFATDYDTYEGIVFGSHGSMKLRQTVNSTLLNRIVQLIQDAQARSVSVQAGKIRLIKQATLTRQRATQERHLTPHGQGRGGEAHSVVVISCSATKSDALGVRRPKGEGIESQLADQAVSMHLFETRARVLRLIQEGKVDGVEFRQGNRASMPVNRHLLYGPEFGGAINEERYLPAFKRYVGRCYQASAKDWEHFNGNDASRTHILIMSGLYGLIPPTEYIQNYDVHLTDVDLAAGISIQSYWKDRELMTQVLISHLEWIEQNKGPVGTVFDLLSELSYQETINWALIDKRWGVLHRVFERNAGRDALGNIGFWLRDSVLRAPQTLAEIAANTFYTNPHFIPEDRIAFEQRIGEGELRIAREMEPV